MSDVALSAGWQQLLKMTAYNDYVREAKRKLMEAGEIPQNIRPEILQSWIKCKDLQMEKRTVYGGKIPEKEFAEILICNQNLIEVATPIMENICNSVHAAPTALSLSDANCNILKIVAPPQYDKEGLAQKNGYAAGYCWREEDIGTNAMTLGTKLRIPIQTVGAEHYHPDHERFTCTAVPIINVQGELLGCLNSINEMEQYSDYTLGMMIAGVDSIRKQMAIVNRTAFFQNALDSIDAGTIVADINYKIDFVNVAACRILGIESDSLHGRPMADLIGDISFPKLTKRIVDKRVVISLGGAEISCIGTLSSIRFDAQQIGLTFVFREERKVSKSINRMIGNQAKYSFSSIITQSPNMQWLIAEAKKVASSNCNILITGESGTGKELFAQAIHNASGRANGPFVAINCAALPRDLVESELFGYEEGAFTGAKKNGVMGKFELANGGTIFLDEIAEMPIEIQPKLLRVLDSRKLTRLGGTHEQEIDVRIVSATNRDLDKMVADNSFRLDLYYRISVVDFEIPPLRERKNDIPLLCRKFLEDLNGESGSSIKKMSGDYLETLVQYDWRGNVRELQNAVARSYYICDTPLLTARHLSEKKFQTPANEPPAENILLRGGEETLILKALENCHGNITAAAVQLGISKPTLYRKLKKYEIAITKNVSQ